MTNHLKTNDATTDDNHLLGDTLEREGAGRSDNALLINGKAGERSSLAAGSKENILGPEETLTAVVECDLDGVLVLKGAGALDPFDLVLLEKALDTPGETSDGFILGLHELLEVEFHIGNFDTPAFRIVEGLVVNVGVVEQCF